MSNKLYHLYNDDFEITHAQVFEEGIQPENAVYIEYCDFIKPMVNPATLEVYEGAALQVIEEANKPIVPERISKLNLKIQLLLRGITREHILATIDSIPESMFAKIDKDIAVLKFDYSVFLERYNADLNLVATLEGLSQGDLDEIFIQGNL